MGLKGYYDPHTGEGLGLGLRLGLGSGQPHEIKLISLLMSICELHVCYSSIYPYSDI